jgi:EcsC protein family
LSLQETPDMTLADREALAKAVKSLEHPGLAARLTKLIGKPVELIGYALPSFASKAIASATTRGLEAALKVALRTLPRSPRTGSELLHRALATASGAAGGTFGLAALPVELPVSSCTERRQPRPRHRVPSRLPSHEHFRTIHRAADRDLNADGRLVAARPRSLPAAAGRGAAERELSDPLGNSPTAGRRSPDHCVVGRNAARGAVRPNSWPHPDDLLERARDHCDHAAV